jgi:hypothetical protein
VSLLAGIAQLVKQLVMGWKVRGSIPVVVRFSVLVQTVPVVLPASYTMGTGTFPGVKSPRRGVDRPPPFSAEVKEGVELYSPSMTWWLAYVSLIVFSVGWWLDSCSCWSPQPVRSTRL